MVTCVCHPSRRRKSFCHTKDVRRVSCFGARNTRERGAAPALLSRAIGLKVITRTGKAAKAAELWRWHYGDDSATKLPNGRTPDEVYRDLLCLGASPPAEAVEAVIGNDSWTACTCNECGRPVEAVARVGDDPAPDSQTTWLCRSCLEEAASLLEGD